MDAELYVCDTHYHRGKVHAENGQLQLRIDDSPEQPEPVKEAQDAPPAEENTNEIRRNSRRRSRERRNENTSNSTPAQTRSERREARLSGQRKTRTQGDS